MKSFFLYVFDGDGSAMELHGVFHDGEAEARAAHLPASPFVNPVEPLEDAFLVLGRYVDAVVFCTAKDNY